MMKLLGGSLKLWLPFALFSVAIPTLIYTVVQQNYRTSADDPQIQMVEDASQQLSNGATPLSIVPTKMVDVSQSLSPFMMVFDNTGKVLASSGTLNGHPPVLPDGVLQDVLHDNQQIATWGIHHPGELRFTWQPQPSVRLATVISHLPGSHGYVLAARNMREIEAREANLTFMIGGAMVVLLGASLVLILIAP
jgi:hypothetical protein